MRELTKNQWFSDQMFDILIIFLRIVIIRRKPFLPIFGEPVVSGYIFVLIVNGPHSESHQKLVVTRMGQYTGVVSHSIICNVCILGCVFDGVIFFKRV
jgi:hypothetical protein